MTVELLPHQRKAVDELSNGRVLVGGVGTGKTVTALVYFWEKELGGTLNDWGSIKTPKDIYVLTTARKRDDLDWQKWGAKFGLGKETSFSLRGIKLTVDSYNNIEKYKDVKDAFFIFDEQRLVGSGAWSKAFIKIAQSNRWVLLSATPGDTWEDYIPLFIANGFYKTRTQFKREHIVYNTYSRFPKVDHYIVEGKLIKLKRSLLVEMPYERHTTRHIHTITVDHDVDLFNKVVKRRWHVYENRPLRDVSELFSVMRKVVNSDESRLAALSTLLETHPRVIVFYNFDYELEILRSLATDSQVGVVTRSSDISNGLTRTLATSTQTMSDSTRSISSRNQFIQTGESRKSQKTSCMDHSGLEHTDQVRLTRGRSMGRRGVSECVPITSEDSKDFQSTTQDQTGTEFSNRLMSKSLSTPEENQSSDSLEMENGSPRTIGMSTLSQHLRSQTENKECQKAKFDSSSLHVAEWNGHRHDPIPDSDRWVYLVQYVAGAEAWDCITTDAVVFYSLTYSYKNFVQAQGRIDRLNTPYFDLHYYVLRSKSFIDLSILKALFKKQDFNERNFVKNFVGT